MPALAQGCAEMGVDSYIILDDVDTIDGTAEVAEREFAAVGIPGYVIKAKTSFETLAAKRNWLLTLPETREGADYLFVTQSDEPPSGSLDRSQLTEPLGLCTIQDMTKDLDPTHVPVPVEWMMPLFIRTDVKCHWEGLVHELLLFDGQYNATKLESPRISRFGSNATQEVRAEQARVLEEELAREDAPRTAFYLAQTYQNLGREDDAVEMYLHRVTLSNGFDEEQYCAMYRVGQLLAMKDPFRAARAFMDAWSLRTNRKEPLYHLALISQRMGNNEAALIFCNQMLTMPDTTDQMFVERWIEQWGQRYIWSIAAWWCGIEECYAVMDELLERTDLPPEVRKNIETNRALPPRAEIEAKAQAEAGDETSRFVATGKLSSDA